MNGTNAASKKPEKKTKREPFRINALDVLILLLIVAAIAAFLLRGWVQMLFAEEGTSIVTYTFEVADVEAVTAESLKDGVALYGADGTPMGEVLTCVSDAATDERTLSDGRVVRVRNGRQLLSGTVTATGYMAEGFICLNGGVMLVPGETVYVSTGDAFFAFSITAVTITGA